MSVLVPVVSESKVGHPHILVAVQQDVFWLQVSVDHIVLMTIMNGLHNLMKDPTGLLLLQGALVGNVIKEFTPCQVLHDDQDTMFILQDILHVHNVGVAQRLHQSSLPGRMQTLLFTLELRLLQDLDRNLFPRHVVLCQQHLSKITLTNGANIRVAGDITILATVRLLKKIIIAMRWKRTGSTQIRGKGPHREDISSDEDRGNECLFVCVRACVYV